MRKTDPVQIFLEHIISLITNLLITNKNYNNDVFLSPNYNKYKLLEDTKRRSQYILEEIEKTKHLVEDASMYGILERIMDEIREHDKQHPSHGVGCACHDKHAGAIRKLLSDKGLRVKHDEATRYNPDDTKSLRNFTTVLSYIVNNP